MADYTVQTVVEAGITPSYAAAASSDAIPNNDGQIMLHVKNGGGSSDTVTAVAQNTAAPVPGMGNLTRGNIVVAVPNGQERMIGPFPAVAFNDGNGKVQITHSFLTSVTVAAIKLPHGLSDYPSKPKSPRDHTDHRCLNFRTDRLACTVGNSRSGASLWPSR